MSGMKRSVYKTQDGDVPYVRVGKGKVLVLIPPFRSDIRRLQVLIEYLSGHFEVFVPELPGVGCETGLGGRPYTIKNYAEFFRGMLSDLDIDDYVLSGFCLGGLIAVKMVQQGATPKSMILWETFDSYREVHLSNQAKMLVGGVMLLKSSRIGKILLDKMMHNDTVVAAITNLIYIRRKRRKSIVKYQSRLTTMMSGEAVIDILSDMMSFDLFVDESRVWELPVLMLCIEHDDLIDMKNSVKKISRHFVNLEIAYIPFEEHAPSGPITTRAVEGVMGSVDGLLVRYGGVKREV
jgi:pimeloyl-ACP methyl ester carboxylesterase